MNQRLARQFVIESIYKKGLLQLAAVSVLLFSTGCVDDENKNQTQPANAHESVGSVRGHGTSDSENNAVTDSSELDTQEAKRDSRGVLHDSAVLTLKSPDELFEPSEVIGAGPKPRAGLAVSKLVGQVVKFTNVTFIRSDSSLIPTGGPLVLSSASSQMHTFIRCVVPNAQGVELREQVRNWKWGDYFPLAKYEVLGVLKEFRVDEGLLIQPCNPTPVGKQ